MSYHTPDNRILLSQPKPWNAIMSGPTECLLLPDPGWGTVEIMNEACPQGGCADNVINL